MPVFLVPLHEFNKCHAPAGSPQGGQFCATGDTGYPPLARAALDKLRPALLEESFGGGRAKEVMAVVGLDGHPVGGRIHGTEDRVEVTPRVWNEWLEAGPVITAHTHPGSATFSPDDLTMHNDINRVGQALHPDRPLPIRGLQVYGEDGSWYDLQFTRVLDDREMLRLGQRFQAAWSTANKAAHAATVAWAKTQPWAPGRLALTLTLDTMGKITNAAQQAGERDALARHFERQFRDAIAPVWQALAGDFGLRYRYYVSN
jgi:hypothetical protein